jgi:hypothetical protein
MGFGARVARCRRRLGGVGQGHHLELDRGLSRGVVPDNRADEHAHRDLPHIKRVKLVYVFIEEDHKRVETTRRAPVVLCGEILEPSPGSTAARAWRRSSHLRHADETAR